MPRDFEISETNGGGSGFSFINFFNIEKILFFCDFDNLREVTNCAGGNCRQLSGVVSS